MANRSQHRVLAAIAAVGLGPLVVLAATSPAHAQIAGTTNRPLPNVLLLVDTSGSMERMPDNSLPSANRNPTDGTTIVPAPPTVLGNACSPGVPSNPNRWGMLVQALTGNMQPFFSCNAMDRTGAAFKNEFKIANQQVYDADYFLPYHRPLAGTGAVGACAFAPYNLGGVGSGSGVGPVGRGTNTAPNNDVRSFPSDAFTQVLNQHLTTQNTANAGLLLPANACNYQQATDGQLDATRDYIRFGLMTFDNDPAAATGTTIGAPPSGTVQTANPFLGQWTYVRSPSNPNSNLGIGLPGGCLTGSSPFDVGARHWAAPPWEGRMIPFPDPDANIFDIQTTNEQIQQVLMGTRPYGATPIDGMMEDARDYLWYNDYGPLGSQAGFSDPYVNAACRDQYIILLTDGAPNMDMRPACEGAGPPVGICPYPSRAAQTADALANGAGGRRVRTFVIGFSVNGSGDVKYPNDGFPGAPYVAPNNNCKAWYNGVTGNGVNPAAMHAICSAPAPTSPPKGSTADACCQLSEIAYYGTPAHDTPPFFAETQADLVLSFGRILGNVSKTATTRTLPGYSPAVSVAGTGVTADYIASFIPNALKVWSGEIDRTRSVCVGATPTVQTQSVSAGDSFAANTAAQAVAGKRRFVSVVTPKRSGSGGLPDFMDTGGTLRPWTAVTTAYSDSLTDYPTTEVTGLDSSIASSVTDFTLAMSIDATTCKRSRAVDGATIPALGAAQCKDVVWGFATAHATAQGPLVFNGYDFNVRCRGAGGLGSGFCSVSGGGCSVLSAACPVAGEVCVPECAALGAVYRSSPTLVGPPNEFLRDEFYRAYSDARRTRRPAMFVATTDGVLHAYKALAGNGPPSFDPNSTEHELWAFVPPAVLPKLSSNYPTGQQILLDGTPVVRDVVWDKLRDTATTNSYHTTLVAGMGAGGGGYYALNVSDADCGGTASANACLGTFTPSTTFAQIVQNSAGPNFLWQLTDIAASGVADPAKKTRLLNDTVQQVALFGKESGTPAIATLFVNPDGAGPRQIGVAILPGGIDGPPVKGGTCTRAINGGSALPFLASDYDFSDNVAPLGPRTAVRQWGSGGADPCRTAPVPGRGVTIVRLDTGEVLRHFGRIGQDVPGRLNSVTTATPFDSPIIGTPLVYPSTLGATAQRVFVGDADGTLWRIDVSSPNPASWKVNLFQDLVSRDLATGPGAAQSQPIQVAPVLSLDPFGGIVVNAATGDQENVIASANERNYLFSVQEQRPISATQPGRAVVRWYQTLTAAERVTGPMTVFDRTLYFATYRPMIPTAAACTKGGTALLWGMDFFNANGGVVSAGGAPRWCPIGQVDSVTGACLATLVPNEDPSAIYPALEGAIIPGVTIRATQPCATFGGPPNDPLITGMTSTRFDLYFGATAGRAGSPTGTPTAARPDASNRLFRPLPRTTATIDAWAFVVD